MPSALASTSPSTPKPNDAKTVKFHKTILPLPPIELFKPINDGGLTPEESMKLFDEWVDIMDSIEYTDEVAEQWGMRLEKYEGPEVTLYIDSPE